MNSLITKYKLLTILIFVFLLAGCKQPETVVVDENPTPTAPSDTTIGKTAGDDASFLNLVVGEHSSISSLDPLFADNAAEMRAVQLVYEGLVRLDSNGSVVPGIAKNWKVSSDSLEYTFQLRSDIFYHDSNAFSTGTGRRLISEDVKFIFERMARAGVPPKAAHMFMDVKGFDPYFNEQREVYNPADRKLSSISGIQTPNDSTVVLELTDHDPQFLKKLATPLAVIYPREAVGQTVESFSAVGAGPFRFSSRQTDSTLIFSKFRDYYATTDVDLNRVDIISIASESKLFQAMGAGDIHMMPQLGPQLLQEIIDRDGQLRSSYAERYNLQKVGGTTEYILRHNPNTNLSADDANILSVLAHTDSTYFNQFPNKIVTPQSAVDTTDTTVAPSTLANQIFTVYSDDPFVRNYLGNLSSTLEEYDVQLQMMEIRAPSRNTGLFFTKNYSLIPDNRWNNYKELFRFQVQQVALQRSEIEELTFNEYPWWFDLRGVTLPAADNLN
jgi:ABC-type transport system substrate-binding protein